MELAELTPELLNVVLETLLREVGIRELVQLRTVCRTFDTHILDVIYRLPTFEDPNDNSPSHLAWDLRMSAPLMAGLISSKMKIPGDSRTLTSEIEQTLQCVRSIPDLRHTAGYRDALVNLAADFLPVPEVVCRLCKGSYRGATRTLDIALAAALYLDRQDDVEVLLEHGAQGGSQTGSFGEPLAIAACHAGLRCFHLVATKALSTDNGLQKELVASNLLAALEKAAACNQPAIFCEDTWTLLEAVNCYEPEHIFYTTALRSALFAGHKDVVDALLTILEAFDSRLEYVKDDENWLEILRLACSQDFEPVLRLVFRVLKTLNLQDGFGKLLEDASRAGHSRIISILLSEDSGIYHTYYTRAIFWAGRRANWADLSSIFTLFNARTKQALMTALCGASIHGKTGMARVLETASICTFEAAMYIISSDYWRVIESLFGNAPSLECAWPSVPPLPKPQSAAEVESEQLFDSWLGSESVLLRKQCLIGDIAAVQHEIDTSQEETGFSQAFSQALTQDDPAMLLYLSQRIPKSRNFHVEAVASVDSTAIFQVLLDQGWDINMEIMEKEPPLLSRMTASETLTRWLLERGADPNARCYWDITPLSCAYVSASLSTISLMLKQGGDVRKGQLLKSAVERQLPGQLAIIDWLVACGAPLDMPEYKDDPASWCENRLVALTPLQKAAAFNNTAVVRYLLTRGAKHDVEDERGRTAYDIAMIKGNETVAWMIQNA